MSATGSPKQRSCFVVGPIGAEGSEERRKADWLLHTIVRPALAAEPFRYVVNRADEFPDPGMITSQVIAAVLEADLVVADLTGRNPNAFYELAIRHMVERPAIHMIEAGESPPFDVRDYRLIEYKLAHPTDLQDAVAAVQRHAQAIEQSTYRVSNPITTARGHVQLQQSADTKDQILAARTYGEV
jgi:hypothetical protein